MNNNVDALKYFSVAPYSLLITAWLVLFSKELGNEQVKRSTFFTMATYTASIATADIASSLSAYKSCTALNTRHIARRIEYP